MRACWHQLHQRVGTIPTRGPIRLTAAFDVKREMRIFVVGRCLARSARLGRRLRGVDTRRADTGRGQRQAGRRPRGRARPGNATEPSAIGLARPLFVDPARKIAAGALETVRRCTCNPPRCLQTQLTGAICDHWPEAQPAAISATAKEPMITLTDIAYVRSGVRGPARRRALLTATEGSAATPAHLRRLPVAGQPRHIRLLEAADRDESELPTSGSHKPSRRADQRSTQAPPRLRRLGRHRATVSVARHQQGQRRRLRHALLPAGLRAAAATPGEDTRETPRALRRAARHPRRPRTSGTRNPMGSRDAAVPPGRPQNPDLVVEISQVGFR